jgi:predicted Zn-dependent protease
VRFARRKLQWKVRRGSGFPFQFRQSQPRTQIPQDNPEPELSKMEKIAGLKEILALDAKNSFARYGIAMELVAQGQIAEALAEFDTLLAFDSDYTAAYFMSAQTLAAAGRTPEAIERLKAGINCAARTGNKHALSEMQATLDELDR